MADNKFYLNILENLPNGKIRQWLNIGLNGFDRKDIYIFDPRIRKEVHFSLHHDGFIHIRTGKKKEKVAIFKNDWIESPDGKMLKQVVYFRPASDNSYPILDRLPDTPKTINHCFTFRHHDNNLHDVFPNMVFKILLGSPTSNSYAIQHKDINGDPDIFQNENWTVGVKPLILHPREKHDNGTWVWLFSTDRDVPESVLFSPPNFEIGGLTDTHKFIVSRKALAEGEVVSVYYRL